MSRWIVLMLLIVSVRAHAASVCLEPAARGALMDMVVDHTIDRTLPPGWTLSRIDPERSYVSILLHKPEHMNWMLMLYATDADDQPPLTTQIQSDAPAPDVQVMRDVTATINAHMPRQAVGPCDGPPPAPHDTGPAPWSRTRALIVGTIAALSLLGALVFVLIQ